MTERVIEQKHVTLGPGRWYSLGATGVQVFITDGPMVNLIYRHVENIPDEVKVNAPTQKAN